ncbi:cytochrome P450 [Fomitopsis betulina]|nr:cytochrome P450 [Fomitopsis betulina]
MDTAAAMIPSYAYIVAALVIVLVYRKSARRTPPLPPGPKRLPLIGNVLEPISSHPEHTFALWAKQYGDLVYAEFFGHGTLIINSQHIAHELLEKRGSKYSGRPRLTMLREVLGWEMITGFLPYPSESHRKGRKWTYSAFGDKKSAQKHDALQQRETCVMLLNMMDTPDNYAMHIKRFVAALILESVYGHHITSLDDKYVMMIDRAAEESTKTGPAGGTPVDFMPILQHVPAWMPGAGWKRKALRTRELVMECQDAPYRMTRDATLAGQPGDSLVGMLVENSHREGTLEQDVPDIRGVAGSAYAAGTDTTKASYLTFIMAMVIYPNVYKKAQEEVDRVIGRDRLPTHEDRENLPYIECILKEVYRWHPPIPLGLPHYVTEDDEYDGYWIPKDTTVMTNLWSICRDERVYNDPHSFIPERFMSSEGSSVSELDDPYNVAFGHGRRLCAGRLFADRALFLAFSSTAATLDIRKARDSEGREITPKAAWVPAFISPPEDFECVMSPRSAAARNLVAENLTNFST